MKKLRLLEKDNPLHRTHLRQILFATQLALIAGIANLVFFDSGNLASDNFFGIRYDVIWLGVGAILPSFGYILVSQGRLLLAGSLFIWVCTLVLVCLTWLEGGVYSLIILAFPLVLIFSALYADFLEFISISVVLFISILIMGLNHSYNWYSAPPNLFVTGNSRTFSGLIIIALTSYIAGIFGSALKASMAGLKSENQRVKASKNLIKQLAEYDVLTGLLNRKAGKVAYQQLVSGLNGNECLVFYFVDLDNFKNINDLFDHRVGDELLKVVSQRIDSIIGCGDVACRLGGDEFIIFMRVNQFFDHDYFAKNLIELISQPFDYHGAELEVTASIGVAVIKDNGLRFEEVLKKSDVAMYQAKQAGKNQYHYYNESLQKAYMRNLSIVTGLRDAVRNDLLDLHFQPKFDLKTNRIYGAEALLRWSRNNPQKFRPDEFIPVIEATDLIHYIGSWVVEEACKHCKKWADAGNPISVAVNVSATQLTRPAFYESVQASLERTGLEAKYLEIELTEHFLINESQVVSEQLALFKELGVSLAIDDFGTGYSNMGYLSSLQIDVLKLDRCFISKITDTPDNLVIVTAIIQMAKVLGMKVVAEGIEALDERAVLADLNCDYGQGYLWSKPVPGEQFMALLEGHSEDHFALGRRA